jgi:hypothetical protein
MMKKRPSALLSALVLSLLCAGTTLIGGEPGKTTAPPPAALAGEGKPIRDPVAQLRGKLLYKRSQMRKLERSAVGNDPALGEKVSRLEAEIEALYSAVEPKLTALYAEEKELNRQIESLSKKE